MVLLRHAALVLNQSRRRFAFSSCRCLSTSSSETAATSSATSPLKTRKPFYITTPIFYPNASPHIGHLYSLVAADVFARYQRQRGRDVKFLAGTDEHGMKIQKAAQAHFGGTGGREKEFCDTLSERFRDLGRTANISNTCFMRTTSEEHHHAVEDVWRKLYAKGFIYKGQYSGWYSVTDECFYTDAQVAPVSASSTNPATSNQPTSEKYVSLETGAAVEWCAEENYMFRLSAFRSSLLSHYTSRPDTVYPPQYRDQVLGMLGAPSNSDSLTLDVSGASDNNATLEDISISRPRSRLSWGIQVPDDPAQTVYVWFDALLIYLTGAGYPWRGAIPASSAASETQREDSGWLQNMVTGGWPADIQVIGKDILRFHAIYLPAILLALSAPPLSSEIGTSLAYKETTTTQKIPLAHTLLTHAHWTSSSKKMSKSLGNVADPLAAIDKYGVGSVRFYLMRVGGRWRGDVDWSDEQLDKHYKEIQAQLGNYFLRITSPRIAARAIPSSTNVHEALPEDLQQLFISRNNVLRLHETTTTDPNHELLALTLALSNAVIGHMETYEAGLALGEIMTVLKVANKTITDVAPWASSVSPSMVHTTRLVALETLRVVGGCLKPFMPEVGVKLGQALGGEDILAEKNTQRNDRAGHQELEAFWERWNGKEVTGVKLF